MSTTTKVATTAGAFLVAGVAATLLNGRQRQRRKKRRGEDVEFGSVHSDGQAVIASDGLALHVEVDDGPSDKPTIVFLHGWVCTLDTWHYQRLALAGDCRLVFVDHRGHGQSARTFSHNSSFVDLADDALQVINAVVPNGPIILVGHSMGGMTIMKLAEDHPELFGSRVTGVVLIGTSAGRLMRSSPALRRIIPLVRATSPVLDWGRAFNSYSVIKRWGLGPEAEEKHVDMTNEMLLKAPTRVLMDFYPNFIDLDLADSLPAVGKAATVVVGGTDDQVTPFKHSERLAKLIPDAQLVTVEGAGHMMMFEQNVMVTEVIESLAEKLS